MIFALLLIPSLLASWFCYWFSSIFPSLSNRTSKIICIACPFVSAILLGIFASTALEAPVVDFEVPYRTGWVIGGTIIAVAALLVVPTLLLAFAAARLRRDPRNRKKPQAQ